MFTALWDWLATLQPSSASFVGTLTGSSLGLIALLLGAVFNAHLNRKRDDRLRNDDARGVAAALRAELSGMNVTLARNADSLENAKSGFVTPDLAHSIRVMPLLLGKLGILDGETIQHVISIYVSIDQYCRVSSMMGGSLAPFSPPDRRLIALPIEKASEVAKLNRRLASMIRGVIDKLDAFLAGRNA